MIKSTIMYLFLCALPLAGSAQSSYTDNTEKPFERSTFVKKIFKHFDISASIGTNGFGFEMEAPLCKWAKVRFGGTIRPVKTYNVDLPVWYPLGKTEDDAVMKFISSAMNSKPSSTVTLEGRRKMQNLKLIFEFYPIKNHHNFYIAAGVFYGNNDIVSATNTNYSYKTLTFMREYNMLYANATKGSFMDLSQLNISLDGNMQDILNKKIIPQILEGGDMTIPIGTYSHDIYGANGQVLHKAGDYIMLRPNKNDVIGVSATVNNLKPYIGVGYTLPVSKDKRSSISLDAGILYWGGTPSVTTEIVEGNDADGNEVTTRIDLLNDADHLTGDFGEHIRAAKNYPIFPEVSLRFTRRIW